MSTIYRLCVLDKNSVREQGFEGLKHIFRESDVSTLKKRTVFKN
tara:strand:+ start:406 stop:537 length:132 start_codon:yes stop_codon:yes gene_type:complete